MCSNCPAHGPETPEVLRLLNEAGALLDTHGQAALSDLTDDQVIDALVQQERIIRRIDGLGARLDRELDNRDTATRSGPPAPPPGPGADS